MKIRLLLETFKFLIIFNWQASFIRLFLVLVLFSYSHAGVAYENLVDNEKIALTEALHLISMEYQVFFSYDQETVRDIEVRYEPDRYENAEHALNRILRGTSLQYKVFNNRYIILYESSPEAINSLKDMVQHLESVINKEEKTPISRKKMLSLSPLPSRSATFSVKPVAFSVSGTVTDNSGEPLIGVNIQVRGSNKGTSTDFDGKFILEDIDENAVLVISYVGYQTQEVQVSGKSVIDIVLLSDTQLLDEVVVVGYGTQKKVNLTGSVSSISSKDLEKRSVTKPSLALVGQVSGVSIRQGSGNPAKNGASLLVRGPGTFSGAGISPLVLIDGIESSLDNIDPSDIANISVLKDAASASIFGSKAANGVVLVETKSGDVGKPVIRYNGYIGKLQPTFIPEMINSWEYATVINSINPGTYTDEDIQKYKSGSDRDKYPNFDHIDYLFGSGKGIETKHNITASGGTEISRYLFSFGYYNNQSIVKKNDADRIDLRLNLNTKINDKLQFIARLSGYMNKNKEPGAAGVGGIAAGAMRNSNIIPGPTPDGFYGRNETLHPEADLDSESFIRRQNSGFYSNGQLIWDVLNDFKITGQAGYTLGNGRSLTYQAKYPVTPSYGVNLNSLTDSWSNGSSLTLRGLGEYDKTIKNHTVQLLGGVEAISNESKDLSGYRDDFPNNQIYVINAGATARGRQNGSASKNTLLSYFARVNYNYLDKYLVEANIRYDGSSRFSEENRWGSFPSFSVGWRLSEEEFFSNTFDWIDETKIRLSWGSLGNQAVGDYPYQNLLSLGINYPFGNELAAGAAINTIANQGITWETTEIKDIGIDLSFLEYKMNVTIDYYIKTTSDILYPVSVSNILGASPSASNAGSVENKGWDFLISYQNMKGDLTYGVSANLSLVQNKVISIANLENDIGRGLFLGYPIGSSYGYVSDGLFANDAEVENYAKQPFSNLAMGGGIKFVDLSGPDGEPDGVVNTTYDRTIIGQPRPTSTYAVNLNAGYKNFDLFVLLQGEGGRKAPVSLGQFFYPLENNSNIQRTFYENSWSDANPNPNAEFPKIVPTQAGFWNSNPVDFWYRDATFLRIKSVQLGYSFPQDFVRKSFLQDVRIYLSGENLATFSKYYDGWDPEINTGGGDWFYPLIKVFSFGADIRF